VQICSNGCPWCLQYNTRKLILYPLKSIQVAFRQAPRVRTVFYRTWVSGEFSPELWTYYDHNGTRTTNAAEGWHNSLNTHFGTQHPSLRVFLHWLQKCQFQVQSRCIQLAAAQTAEAEGKNFEAVITQLWTAKLEYGMEIGRIFAFAAPDMNGAYLSRVYLRSVTENYNRRCSHLFGCN